MFLFDGTVGLPSFPSITGCLVAEEGSISGFEDNTGALLLDAPLFGIEILSVFSESSSLLGDTDLKGGD